MAMLYERCPICNGGGPNPFADLPACPGCGGERYVATGITEGQVDLYRRKLAQGTNYVGDRETRPRRVWFRSGRVVQLRCGPEGHYLEISWDSPGTPRRLAEGLRGVPPLDEDGREPKPGYRVTVTDGGNFAAWKRIGGAIGRIGGGADAEDAYEAVLLDLGFYCPTIYLGDEDDDVFRSGCPTLEAFGVDGGIEKGIGADETKGA